MEALKIKVNRVLAACALTRLSTPEKHGPRSSLRDSHSKGKLSPSELSPYVRTASSLSPGTEIATTVMDRELASLHIEPAEGTHNAASREVVRSARICTPENCLKDIPSAYEVENDMYEVYPFAEGMMRGGGRSEKHTLPAPSTSTSPPNTHGEPPPRGVRGL